MFSSQWPLPLNWNAPIKVTDPQEAWVTYADLRKVATIQSATELGFYSEAHLNAWLDELCAMAQSYVARYLRTNYEGQVVPQGVKEATLRLAANLYSYVIQVKRGILFRTSELETQIPQDAVFTKNIRNDLDVFRRTTSPIGVGTV